MRQVKELDAAIALKRLDTCAFMRARVECACIRTDMSSHMIVDVSQLYERGEKYATTQVSGCTHKHDHASDRVCK